MAGLRERARGEAKRWLPPRGLRLALPLALAAYAAVGFLVVPWLVQRQLPGLAADATGGSASVQEVRANPFALSAELRGFELKGRAGEPLLGFDRLFVDFELRSLIEWAFTFREIRVGRPWVDAQRAQSGAINLEQLIPPDDPAADAAPADAGLPRLVIDLLEIEAGEARVADLMPTPPFRTRFGPLGVKLSDFSTLPDETGQQQVQVTTEHGASIAWQGTLTMQPFKSEGRVAVRGEIVPLALAYLAEQLSRDVEPGTTEFGFDYQVEAPAGGGIVARIRDGSALWQGPIVRTRGESAAEVLRMKELRVSGAEVDWPEQAARVASVQLDGIAINAWQNADGTLSFDALLAALSEGDVTAASAPEAKESGSPAWSMRVAELKLVDLQAKLEDRSLSPAGQLAIADLDASVRELSSEPNARAPFELKLALASGGTIGLAGDVALLPDLALAGRLAISELALGVLQPWAAAVANVRVAGGALSVDAKLASSPAELLELDGAISIAGFDVRDDQDRPLVGWQRLAVDRVLAKLDAKAAEVSEIALDQPYLRLLIARDRSTNFDELLRDEPPALVRAAPPVSAPAAEAPAAEPPPLALAIARVRVREGSADFSDLSLVLPFATQIQSLDGEIGALSTRSREPARIALEGQVGEYGLMRVSGSLLAMDPEQNADVGVLFRNVDMPSFTPYSVDFAGRRIAQGKLTLDLHYKLDARQLAGENKITLSDFALGERVEAPNAMSLPLDLAVALLKDANGVIDLDVPVSGNLDDPEFGYGRVLWKALVNLIVKIATSPFRLLGNLVGLDDEGLEQIAFEPGRSDLLPPEREKLAKVGEALATRPQLSLEIAGAFDPERDASALREARVAARIDARLAAETGRRAREMLAERELRALEQLSSEADPDLDLQALRKTFTTPPPDAPEAKPRFDAPAYGAELRRRLVLAEPLAEADLHALANARAASVVAALQGTAPAPSAQLRIGAPRTAEAGELGVPLELTAVAGGA